MLPLGLKLDKYSGLDWRSAHDLMVPCQTYRFGSLELALMCAAGDAHGPGEGVDAMHFVVTNMSEHEVISDIRISVRTSHESKFYVIGHTPEEVRVHDALAPGAKVATQWFYTWPYWNNEEHKKETFNMRLMFWVTYNVSFANAQQHWDEMITMEPPDAGDRPHVDYSGLHDAIKAAKNKG